MARILIADDVSDACALLRATETVDNRWVGAIELFSTSASEQSEDD